VGHFLEDFYNKLRKVVSPEDEIIEVPPIDIKKAEKETVESSRLQKANTPQLVEGIDFYWEGQYMVLTAKYLLNRGYCCESGCRHCPYGFNKKTSKKA
jgi:hypothetical protein